MNWRQGPISTDWIACQASEKCLQVMSIESWLERLTRKMVVIDSQPLEVAEGSQFRRQSALERVKMEFELL